MKLLLVLFLFLNTASVAFASSLSVLPLLSKLEARGWRPWILNPGDQNFHLMSVNDDLSQAIVIKPTTHWDKEFKPNTWYSVPEGSAYFFEQHQVAIYIFDFFKRTIDPDLKKQLLNILDHSVQANSPPAKKFPLHFFSSAYASEYCSSPIGDQQDINQMAEFSMSLDKSIQPFSQEYIWNMLKRCGGAMWDGVKEEVSSMTLNPITWMKETWSGLKGIVDFVANIQTALPKIISELQNLSKEEVIDLICPMIPGIAIGIISGKIMMDATKLAFHFIKKLKSIQNLAKRSKTLKMTLAHLRPKTSPLSIKNGRAPRGTREGQLKSLSKIVDGEITINGEPLKEFTTYSGVILDDGRLLLHPGNHDGLVMPGNKVMTALEIRTGSKGKILLGSNQSSTFLPDYEGCKKWLTYWMKTQNGGADIPDAYGHGFPFRFPAYK